MEVRWRGEGVGSGGCCVNKKGRKTCVPVRLTKLASGVGGDRRRLVTAERGRCSRA